MKVMNAHPTTSCGLPDFKMLLRSSAVRFGSCVVIGVLEIEATKQMTACFSLHITSLLGQKSRSVIFDGNSDAVPE